MSWKVFTLLDLFVIGIGLIEKCVKNKIKWKGTVNFPEDTDANMFKTFANKRKALKKVKEEDVELDAMINKLQRSFNELSGAAKYNEYAFVTYEDLAKLSINEENEESKLLIIKALPGTEMEVPNPEEVEKYLREHKEERTEEVNKEKETEDKKYILHLKSKSEEIKVYAVENEEHADNDMQEHNKEEDRNTCSAMEGLGKIFAE